MEHQNKNQGFTLNMIPFLPTLANSDPWDTTNSFCSESSRIFTSMPCGGSPFNQLYGGKDFKLYLHLWVVLGLHSDWVFVHILRTSLIVQSWEQNRFEKDILAFSKSSKAEKNLPFNPDPIERRLRGHPAETTLWNSPRLDTDIMTSHCARDNLFNKDTKCSKNSQ